MKYINLPFILYLTGVYFRLHGFIVAELKAFRAFNFTLNSNSYSASFLISVLLPLIIEILVL